MQDGSHKAADKKPKPTNTGGQAAPQQRAEDISLMRALGGVVGAIFKPVSGPGKTSQAKNVIDTSNQPTKNNDVSNQAAAGGAGAGGDNVMLRRTTIEEEPGDRPGVVLRRTVIEEVVLPASQVKPDGFHNTK